MSHPNYKQEAFNKAYLNYANSPEGLLIRGYTPKVVYKTVPTGYGSMKSYKETSWISPEGEEIKTSPTATLQATSEPIKDDPINNPLNWMMLGGFGLGRVFGSGTILNTISGILSTLPKLSFSNTYTTGQGLSLTPKIGAVAADAGLATVTSVPTVLDINKNGVNLENGVNLGLSVTPIVPYVLKQSFKLYPRRFFGSNNGIHQSLSPSNKDNLTPFDLNNNFIRNHLSRIEDAGMNPNVKVFTEDYLPPRTKEFEYFYDVLDNGYKGNYESAIRDTGGAFVDELNSGHIFTSKNNLKNQGFSDDQIKLIISHEIDHARSKAREPVLGFDLSKLSDYFKNSNGAELSARGSLIKDYLGFKKNSDVITPAELKYASKYYISDTGLDNNMLTFFKAITDYKKAAEWLSKNSTMIGSTTLLGTTLYNKKDE